MERKKILVGILAAALTVGISLPALAAIDSVTGNESCIMSKTQILIGDANASSVKEHLADAKKKSAPNTVTHLETIAAGQVSKLNITAERCGVAVERSNTGSFEVELIGADNKENIKVSVRAAGDTLTLSAKGSKAVMYINSDPDFRVNCVVLRVPKALYATQNLTTNGIGLISTRAVAKSVTGQSKSGVIRVDDETISESYKLETGRGSVAVNGRILSGTFDLYAKNGSVVVETGDQADGTVSGTLRAETENGSVNVKVARLGGAVLKSKNGSVLVEAGELTGNTSMSVDNGSLRINLQKAVNLHATFSNGWGRMQLPSGWSADTVLGTGTPTLTAQSTNGNIEVSLGKSKE